jgi:predicted acyltransferase
MKNSSWLETIPQGRVLSLDVYRGFAMLLLIAEVTGLYDLLINDSLKGSVLYAIGLQFHHSAWQGLRLWDMGQAFFMFISGTAMAFSWAKRFKQGTTWLRGLIHAAKRALILFFLGWALYVIYPPEGAPGWAFLLDILPALAFGGLVAYTVIKWPARWQFAFSIGLILLTELLYRLLSPAGFNQAFTMGHNFGAWLDQKLWGGVSPDGWVTFNIVPSAAFVIWGLITGNMLRGNMTAVKKLRILLACGLLSIVSGLALSFFTPIIRKITTTSFMLISLGFCLLFLALSYFIIDILKLRHWALVPLAVGMNPLFIFLFTRSGGADWFMEIVRPFAEALPGWVGQTWVQATTALGCLSLMCLLCFFLFKKRIFLKT